MRFTVLTVFILLMGFSGDSFGQADSSLQHRRNFSIFGDAVFPVGPFASTSGRNASYATLGYGFGVCLTSDVAPHVEVGFDAAFTSPGIDEHTIQEQIEAATGIKDATINAGRWKLISVFGNLGLNTEFLGNVRLYVRGKLGGVYTITPSISQQRSHSNIGAGMGVGFRDNRFDVGLHFFTAFGDDFTSNVNFTQPPSVIQLRFGIILS